MRTFLFTRPRGNSLYFLHGELLCQGAKEGTSPFPPVVPDARVHVKQSKNVLGESEVTPFFHAIISLAHGGDMPSLLVRDLDAITIKRLKARAAQNRRSLQAEAKAILESSTKELTLDTLRREAEKFSKKFAGRRFTDSVELIREDRER